MDLNPANTVARSLLAVHYTPEQRAPLVRSVYDAIRVRARHITEGNFRALAGDDLELLFDLYDQTFFAGRVRQLLTLCRSPLTFHASSRLTRSGGLTKQFRPPRTRPTPLGVGFRYEIVLSSTLLFQTFRDVQRDIVVSGLLCHDRLEATQRIMEHEIIHLVEMIAQGQSSCSAAPFKQLALNWFGHTQTKHDLVTRNELAREKYAIRVGARVRFTHDGRTIEGLVNRITQRATILVESPEGELYTSGKRYIKYYVPLNLLQPVPE